MQQKIFAVWSGPRNISTTLMRSFSMRDDFHVIDEPFYGDYLCKNKVNHPGEKEIISTMETEHALIVKSFTEIAGKHKNQHIYLKMMTHHFDDSENNQYLFEEKYCHYFLIRHPILVINSLRKRINLVDHLQTGFEQYKKIYALLEKKKEIKIINSDNFLLDPEASLKILCKNMAIEFDKNMLSWEKGPTKYDGIWGKDWYKSLYNSTGFTAKKNIDLKELYETFSDLHKEIYHKVKDDYKKLAKEIII